MSCNKLKLHILIKNTIPWQSLTLQYRYSMYYVLQIAMVPYGNAEETQNPDGSWSFECQHGDAECRGNLLEVSRVK